MSQHFEASSGAIGKSACLFLPAASQGKRVDQLKKDGKKSVLLLVSNGEGELRFVALSVQ